MKKIEINEYDDIRAIFFDMWIPHKNKSFDFLDSERTYLMVNLSILSLLNITPLRHLRNKVWKN